MTVWEALSAAKRRLSDSESAASDARALLAHVLNTDKVWLFTHPEYVLTVEETQQFEALVKRAESGEPLPYILGRWAFYDRDFYVTPDVLIPRPETELLLEQALNYAGDRVLNAVDVGTGSGALAITLAALRPKSKVYATDISPNALAVAQRNAVLYSAPVTFYKGDLLNPLIERGIYCDLIMANMPYIPTEVAKKLRVSQYEPVLALDGGDDGLKLIRRLLSQVSRIAKPETIILLEIMSGQGDDVTSLIREHLPDAQSSVYLDYAGHDRIVRINRVVQA